MKPGDTGWVRATVGIMMSDGRAYVDSGGCHADDDIIPDHPALPAVARWLAGLPAWLDAPELASAIASVVEASREAQARLLIEGDPRGYERGQAYVEACEAIQPHGWEALDALVAALTEVTA